MAEKILVTGGAGYIGSLLVPMLLDEGYEITILDTFTWGVKPVLHYAPHPRCHLITGDIRDKEIVKKEVKKHDTILHLAAIVGYPACAADPLVSAPTGAE